MSQPGKSKTDWPTKPITRLSALPSYMDGLPRKAVKMSVEAIAIVLNHSKARGAAKIVLMGIANHINPDNDGAWPSQAKLASYANVSDRAVRDAVDTLVSLGELRYETAAGVSKSQYKPNRYWLTLSCPVDCDGTTNHRPRVEVSDTQGGSFQQSGWKPASDEPLIEPIKELISKSSKIDPDFQVTETMRDWVIDNKLAIDVEAQTLQFVDYHIAKGSLMKDWTAAWRTWMRKAAEWQKPTWERSKEIQAAESKIKIATEKEWTQQFLAESQKAAESATPPPMCEHGKTLVRCVPCASRLS